MEEQRPTSRFWRFLPYPFYVLAAPIALVAFLAMVIFVGSALGFWGLPGDR